MTTPADPTKPNLRGILCPACGCGHFFLIYVRHYSKRICRRRECRHCGRRITTNEKLVGG